MKRGGGGDIEKRKRKREREGDTKSWFGYYVRSLGVDLRRIISNYDHGRLPVVPRGRPRSFTPWDHHGRKAHFGRSWRVKEQTAGRRGGAACE